MQKFKRNRSFLSVFKNSSLVFQKGFGSSSTSTCVLHAVGFGANGGRAQNLYTVQKQRFVGFSPSPVATQMSVDCAFREMNGGILPKAKHRPFLQSSFFEKKGNIEETLFFNFAFDKGRLKNIVCWFFEKHGQYKTLKFLEKLKEVGFGSATAAGISLGIDDLKIPSQKIALVSTAETKVAKDLVHYRNAKITGIERIQRLISIWNQTNDTLKQEVIRLFESTDLFNPIYMMAFSGARGNMSQVRQLVGMRGLMSDPQGQIIDFPIQSNFREGLTLTEYLISTYGARKGIVDTALRTATAGYLTRRLVDVAQHTIVSKFDCGTMRGIFLFDMKDGKKTIYSFQNRLVGRVLAQNIEFLDKSNEKRKVKKKQLAFRNQEIDSKLAQAISNITKKAFVRSPLTCETFRFVCQLCYGWSLSHGKLVSVGEAVGIIAAQSIGEPGTQLTMRTFHTGGVFAGGLTDQILAPFDGKMKYLKNIPGSCVRNALSEIAFLTKMPGSFFIEKALPSSEEYKQEVSFFVRPFPRRKKGEIFKIPAYAILFCRNNEFVRKKQVLAQFSSILKKMQYGRAEQTLSSTFAGEFVFGKSFFFPQNLQISPGSSFSKSESRVRGNLSLSKALPSKEKVWQTDSQSLLLEKRKGDFSEVEFKHDVLWKSQNWTTVWILSGNVFSDSLNRNFPFHEGDFLKKTSVLQRILWTKEKNSKYFLYGPFQNQVHKKTKKKKEYLLAFEQKKIQNSFISDFSFFENSSFQFFKNFQKKSVRDVNKHSSIGNVQTNFTSRFFTCMSKNEKKKNFKISQQNIKKIFPNSNSLLINRGKILFFDNQKNDYFFIQNKSTRFFTDFQKNIQKSLPFLEKYRSLSPALHAKQTLFSQGKTKEGESLISQKKKKKVFQKDPKKGAISFFFKFLNKRKNFFSPVFLNFMTFSKTFQVSLKFSFFSFLFNDFSETLFFQSQFIFSKKNSKNILFSSSTSLLPFENFSTALPAKQTPSFFQNLRVHSFFPLSPKRQGSSFKKIFLKTSLFLNELPKNEKEKKLFQNKHREKNIFLKKFFLRLPVEKMYYKKFAYFVFLSAKGEKKKVQSSFQTFSTLTKSFAEAFPKQTEKKENSLVEQRSFGKAEPLFLESQNFYGKESPNFFSNCFFQDSQTNTGGIFSSCSFEHNSKKQRVFYFCEKFSDKNQIVFLKPENVQKTCALNNKRQQIPFLSLSADIGFLPSPVCIFQIPTFSFLSFSTNSFLKVFFSASDFSEKQQFLQFAENTKNNKKNKKFQNFFSVQKDKYSLLPLILNKKKMNFPSSFFSFLENGHSFKKAQTINMFVSGQNGHINSGFFHYVFRFPQQMRGTQMADSSVNFAGNGEEKTFSKIEFYDFSKNVLGKQKSQECKKRNSLFLYNFSFQKKFHSTSAIFSQNKTEKSFLCDFYTQEISWLPQENLVLFTSDILTCATSSNTEKNISTLSSFPFSFNSGKEPFLFFANRQGKKKIFSFFPQSFSDMSSHFRKERKQKGFDGFLKISKRKVFQSFFVPGLKTNKKTKAFFSLQQKFSFFSQSEKEKKKSAPLAVQKKALLVAKRQVEKKIPLNQSLRKNIALKFEKRIGNTNFTTIQRIFSKKINKKSLTSTLSKPCQSGKKKTTVFNKHCKNSYLIGKKVQNQCFACLPFQKNSFVSAKQTACLQAKNKLKDKRKNFLEKNKKLQLQIEQGWLVFPFFPCLKKFFFQNHKKIQKKGHFFDKNITFEQNTVFLETVLFENSSSASLAENAKQTLSNSKTNSFSKTEKRCFHVDFVKRNTKCRYFSSFQDKRKKDQFPNFLVHTKEMKKVNVVQFFRPFQYKILQNPQNTKKFFTDIRFQYFSKAISASCFQLYKKYHSTFLNLQKKEFLSISPNRQNKKIQYFKLDIQSNFQNLYFSKEQSPFLSFEFSREQENFKKTLSGLFQNFQFQETSPVTKGKFLKAVEFQKYFQKQLSLNQRIKNQFGGKISKEDFGFGNTISSPSSKIFGRTVQKTFFFYFEKARKEKKNFSFYPVQFLPLLLSLSPSDSKNEISDQSVSQPSSSPTFSLNPFQNTIEFQLFQKRGTFFDERFSFQKFFDFVQTSSFWLNKDRMNFLFSTVLKQKNFQKGQLKENQNCMQNSVFEKNLQFYGSTEFTSPYEGEILSMFTHNMYWWKKASEVSTLQNFEKLFTIVTKKDIFSVHFPQSFFSREGETFRQNVPLLSEATEENLNSVAFSRSNELNFLKQKHLKKLYEVLQNISQQKNSFLGFKDQNETKKKIKISFFVTKYEKKIYTFQNLTVGYPSLFQKPVLGHFVVYGDNFFGSSVQNPGQIIHLSSSSMTLRKGQPCLVSSNGILHFSNTPYIQKNVPLVTLPYQTVQAGDIVQGIPKVEQFFEARTTLQGRLFVSSLPILLKGIFERYKILLPLEQATRQSFLKIQQIIVDGVQRVYRSQGVSITDKHLEVVVRQMTTKVQILNGAQTGFFPGELVSLDLVERLNKFLMVKICYEPVILGITRASLEVESFLSASSFQQTTKILSLAAISRKKDFLKGLKENLLVGNLIPSGTGYFQFSKRL